MMQCANKEKEEMTGIDTAQNLARYIITKCEKDGRPLNNLQLQSILYGIQKRYLQQKGVPAFPEELEAWPFGPAVPEVYYDFCGYGAMPITRICRYEETVILSIDKELIDSIIDEKRQQSLWDAAKEVQKRGGAWDQVYDKGNGIRKIIPKAQIREEK